jgi:hypothetical protein
MLKQMAAAWLKSMLDDKGPAIQARWQELEEQRRTAIRSALAHAALPTSPETLENVMRASSQVNHLRELGRAASVDALRMLADFLDRKA